MVDAATPPPVLLSGPFPTTALPPLYYSCQGRKIAVAEPEAQLIVLFDTVFIPSLLAFRLPPFPLIGGIDLIPSLVRMCPRALESPTLRQTRSRTSR